MLDAAAKAQFTADAEADMQQYRSEMAKYTPLEKVQVLNPSKRQKAQAAKKNSKRKAHDADAADAEEVWLQPEDPDKPQKPASAYMRYGAAKREEMTAKDPDFCKDFAQMNKQISAGWKVLDAAAKAQFTADAEADMQQYRSEMAKYTPLEKVQVLNPSKRQKAQAAKQKKAEVSDESEEEDDDDDDTDDSDDELSDLEEEEKMPAKKRAHVGPKLNKKQALLKAKEELREWMLSSKAELAALKAKRAARVEERKQKTQKRAVAKAAKTAAKSTAKGQSATAFLSLPVAAYPRC